MGMSKQWVPKLPANIVERVNENDGEVSARVKVNKENKLKAYLNMTNEAFISVYTTKGYGRCSPVSLIRLTPRSMDTEDDLNLDKIGLNTKPEVPKQKEKEKSGKEKKSSSSKTKESSCVDTTA